MAEAWFSAKANIAASKNMMYQHLQQPANWNFHPAMLKLYDHDTCTHIYWMSSLTYPGFEFLGEFNSCQAAPGFAFTNEQCAIHYFYLSKEANNAAHIAGAQAITNILRRAGVAPTWAP